MLAIVRSVEFSRRRFVALAVGVLAMFRPGRRGDAAGAGYRVFRLDPFVVDPLTGRSCSVCTACRRHAEHKRFASFAAADARRAHPNCRCAIRAEAVPRDVFVMQFGDPGAETFREVFDTRWIGAAAPILTPPSGGLEMPAAGVR